MLLCCTVRLFAQDPVGIAEFFSAGPELSPPSALNFDGRFRTPLVGAYDLRTESEDFDPGRQEYTLRLNMVTLRRARAQRRWAEQLAQASTYVADREACRMVERKYRAWVDLYIQDQRSRILDSLALVVDDRDKLAARYAAAGLLSGRDRLRNRVARSNLDIQRSDVGQKSTEIKRHYGLQGRELDFSATIDTVGLVIALAAARPPEEIARRRRQERVALLDSEIEVERAEGLQVLDFLQFRYRSNVRDQVFEKFSIGLALRIQDSADRRLKLRELELRRHRIETEGQLEDELRAWRRREEQNAFARALNHYQYVREVYRREADDLRRLAVALGREQTMNPGILLDIRQRGLENQLKLLEELEDTYSAYLDWLEARGEICRGTDGRYLAGTRAPPP